MEPNKVTYIGQVDHRNKMLTFGIKAKDRPQHMYIIGKTGMGKTVLIENLVIQDINNGEGLCIMDPHGSVAEELLDFIPEHRIKDVIYFSPSDGDNPIALNVLEKVEPSKRHLVANGLMAAFKKLFKDQFSARMEYILNNIILALLENDGQTLLGVNRMLTDKDYRNFIVENVTDPSVKAFWTEEYAKYTDKFAAEAAPAIQNKVGQFVSNPLIRNIIGQAHTSFDIRDLMDNKKILIINLSKGKVGEGNANLLGSLLITKIYLGAMSRADVGPYELPKLPPFYFYVDEFQNFANEAFASILSEARKYKLALTVAHQYVEQMTDEVKAAVFGNVGTMISFRIGATDAEIFEKEFAPRFTADDIVNLSAYQIYLRLMIDGVGSAPFSAKTLPPIQRPEKSHAQEVIENSRKMYSKTKNLVEDEVREWYKPIVKPHITKSVYVASAGDAYENKSEYKKPYLPTQTGVKKDIGTKEGVDARRQQSKDEEKINEKFVKIEKVKDVNPIYEKINKHKYDANLNKTFYPIPEKKEKPPNYTQVNEEANIEKTVYPIQERIVEKNEESRQQPIHDHAKKIVNSKDSFVKPRLEKLEKTMSLKESIEKAMREKEDSEKILQSEPTSVIIKEIKKELTEDSPNIEGVDVRKQHSKDSEIIRNNQPVVENQNKKEIGEEVLRALIEE